jgi:hypothetical protein
VLPNTAFAARIRKFLRAVRAPRSKAQISRRDGYVAVTSRSVSHAAGIQGDRQRGLHSSTELRLQPRTYAPLLMRNNEYFYRGGKRLFTNLTERIVSRRTLPDTPANRRLLELRGPTQP